MTRSQNKQQQLEQAKDIVINSIGQTMDLYGTNRSRKLIWHYGV